MWREHLAVCTLYLLCAACTAEDRHRSDGEMSSLMYLENLISKYTSDTALSRGGFLAMYASLQVKDLAPDHVERHDEAQWCQQMFLNSSCTDKCGTGEDVFTTYAVDSHLNASMLLDALPAVVMSLEADHCRHMGVHGFGEAKHRKKPSRKEVWAYGVGFVVLICFVSNLGACLAPLMNSSFFKKLLMFLVSTAVGTLAATGLLVLIPEALDLMSIEETADDYIWKTSTVLGGLFFFYMSERLLKVAFKRSGKKENVAASEVVVEEGDLGTELTTLQPAANGTNDIEDKQLPPLPSNEPGPIKKDKKQVQTVAWIMLLGDGIHKAVDGLAVGAAYSKSIRTGLSLSIAILCEELPHELGDIAILLHSGMSMKKALFYNTLSAACGIIGLVGGISLGENPAANQWIFAVAGGIFLYVPLVDMLPEMSEAADKAIKNGASAFGITLIQLLGLCTGFGIILIVALYAGDIQV
ncbi:metal cation symporter ZIP14-like [Haliotis cracherodii]|uniref:metal cation symporter ZIP14-like n=1 Tax=Haliotis cracherodii TaxID=6455 RepID=UPI0039E8F366